MVGVRIVLVKVIRGPTEKKLFFCYRKGMCGKTGPFFTVTIEDHYHQHFL